MLPRNWRPVPTGDLVRVGSTNDGGYVVSQGALAPVTLLISMGLNDDWTFEADFRRRTGAKILCFDGSVTPRFWVARALNHLARLKPHRALRYFGYRRFFSSDDVRHEPLMVGFDGPGSISVPAIFGQVSEDQIFLKVDIESSEYRIFDDIVAHADRLTGIAMELHDVDLHRERIAEFFVKLADRFTIVHLHGNNFGGTDAEGDPLVIEVSLTRNDLLVTGPEARNGGGQDRPNDPRRPDIAIVFEDDISQEVVAAFN